ncbi:MAG: amidophosphoribosyltransferase [Polyangiales bacterium]
MRRSLTILDPTPRETPDVDARWIDELDDRFKDECGVFGIFGNKEASNLCYLGLHALQHRGQESAGIVTSDDERLYAHRAMGLVHDCFTPDALKRLPGEIGIGHVRYSTAGGSHARNAQPLAVDTAHGSIALGHNGNLTNAEELRATLEARGSIFTSSTDTEVIVHLIALSRAAGIVDKITDALKQVRGAYSLVILTRDAIIAVRDPMGVRPLVLGRLNDAHVVASEPTAFDLIGGQYVRDVEPGEMLVINRDGLRSIFPFERQERHLCVFEYIYFARPDSAIEGRSVYATRKALGRSLAKEHPAEADLVIPVPDSGVPAAIGYSEASGIPFDLGLVRSHYVGRTFIEPSQSIRHFGVRLKLNPVADILRGKRVVVVDDSIVRGTTSRKIVKMIRDAGAREVHVRVSSPPTQWPCFYGIDTPSRRELIASSHSTAEIARYITADSVGYMSLEATLEAVRKERPHDIARAGLCHACFSGDYPIPVAASGGNDGRSLRVIGG